MGGLGESIVSVFMTFRQLAGLATSLALATFLPASLPVIVSAPEDITANVGGRTGFAVTAESADPVVYQWYHNGQLVPSSDTDILLLHDAQFTAAGNYHVDVTNSSGTVTSDSAVLRVTVPETGLVDPSFVAAVEIDKWAPVGFFQTHDSLLVVPAPNAAGDQPALVRLNSNGTLDSSFSFSPEISAGENFQLNLLQTNSRDEILVGYTLTSSYSDGLSESRYYLSRYTPEGAPDGTFPAIELDARISALLQHEGNLIVASRMSLRRFEDDGSPDSTFTPTTFPSDGSVVLDADVNGQIWAGITYRLQEFSSQLNRLADDGELTPHPGPARFSLVPDGGFIGIESESSSIIKTASVTLRGYNRDGALDERFNSNGIGWSFSGGEVRDVRATVLSDGRIVVGDMPSYDGSGNVRGGVRRGHLSRLLPNGEVDPDFQAVFSDLNFFDSLTVHFYPDKQHALVLTRYRARRVSLRPTGAPPPPRVLKSQANTDAILAGDDYQVSYTVVGPDVTSQPKNPFVLKNVQSDWPEPSGHVDSPWGRDEFTWNAPQIIESTPRYLEAPDSITLSTDRRLTLSADIRGTRPLTIEWFRDSVPIEIPWRGTLFGPGGGAGDYRIVATNAVGTTEHTFSVEFGSASRLSNLSTRGYAGTGDEVMIIGFILKGGITGKEVMLRAVGRELRTDFGLSGVLENPRVKLFGGAGTLVVEGDDTPFLSQANGGTLSRFEALGAFPINHGPSSLVFTELPAGPYTMHIEPATGSPGIVLGEIYDADDLSDRLVNVSTRATVYPGDALTISGFAVSGDQPKRLLIRGVGPALTSFGVSNPLIDPTLKVFNSAGELVASNDDWMDSSNHEELQAATAALAFPFESDSSDSALLIEVPPGTYTVQIRGKDDTPGIALVEVYEVP